MLYGLGKASLAERLSCSQEEAEDIIQGLYKSFPTLREYVSRQQNYPFEHGGYINTMLGDDLKIKEFDWYRQATSERERKNLEARISRLGVNLSIQGGRDAVYSRNTIDNNRAKTIKGVIPNIVLTKEITKGSLAM